MAEQDKLDNFMRQSDQAANEDYIFTNFISKWSLEHPNVKVIRIHDSWLFEGSLEECQILLDEAEEFLRERGSRRPLRKL